MARRKLFDEDGNEVKGARRKKPVYKRVWFWVVALFVLSVAMNMGGEENPVTEPMTAKENTESVESKTEPATASSESVEPVESAPAESAVSESVAATEPVIQLTLEEAYQGILGDYTSRLQEAAPRLAEEYNAEYPSNENGLEGLAELSNSKISTLAELANEGVVEMADVYFTKGTGSYEEYETWAGKLMDVYMVEAQQITDAYMQSAQ